MTRSKNLTGSQRELRGWRLRTTFGSRKARAERFERLTREYGKRAAVALSRTRLDYEELDAALGRVGMHHGFDDFTVSYSLGRYCTLDVDLTVEQAETARQISKALHDACTAGNAS